MNTKCTYDAQKHRCLTNTNFLQSSQNNKKFSTFYRAPHKNKRFTIFYKVTHALTETPKIIWNYAEDLKRYVAFWLVNSKNEYNKHVHIQCTALQLQQDVGFFADAALIFTLQNISQKFWL
jgi:hypothetical protein